MKFKVGDKVVLRKDSRWRDYPSLQLADFIGTVHSIYPHPLPYRVDWYENGAIKHNRYDEIDLADAKSYYLKRYKNAVQGRG